MRKLMLYGLIGIGIIIALLFIKSVFKDKLRPNLDSIYKTQSAIILLANEARQHSDSLEIQTAASNTLITVTSQNQQLITYYKEKYGKLPPALKEATSAEVLSSLKSASPGSAYDSKAKELLVQYLNLN